MQERASSWVMAGEPGWLAEFRLEEGELVRFRHVVPEDERLIAQSISTASRETLLHRFFSPIRKVSPELLRKMLAIDRAKELCVVGLVGNQAEQQIICGARYVRLARPSAAEIALTVHDRFQRRGLGGFMLKLLIRLGRSEGIRWFEADVMSSNAGMLRLLEKIVPSRSVWSTVGDVHHFVVDLEQLEVA